MILMIDNYDSFTYNLYQYLGVLGVEVEVRRNDKISLGEIEAMKPERLVISPGPGTPQSAGISISVIELFHRQIPILGVCLGHQAIGAAFGGRVVHASQLMHGKTSEIRHDGKTIFSDLPPSFSATRYHSLAVERLSAGHRHCIVVQDCVTENTRWREFSFIRSRFSPLRVWMF